MTATIKTIYGDLLTERPNSVIIHGCNCQGVMGSGVALAVKNKYPDAFDKYLDLCNNTKPEELLGTMQTFIIQEGITLVNGFTQLDFGSGRQINYEAIYKVFEDVNFFMKLLAEIGMQRTLYFPKIGACRGGGNWRIISTIIEETVDQQFNPTLVEYKPT